MMADFYDSQLPSLVETSVRVDGSLSAFAQYSILTDNRDEVQRRLGEAGIPTAIYYPRPLHLQDAYAAHGDGPGSLPGSEALCNRILALPMHGYMKKGVALRVTNAVRDAVTE